MRKVIYNLKSSSLKLQINFLQSSRVLCRGVVDMSLRYRVFPGDLRLEIGIQKIRFELWGEGGDNVVVIQQLH